MQTVLNAVRAVLGSPDFYIENGNYSGTWDYGLMIEYVVCAMILCIVVSSVFKIVGRLFK